MYQVVQPSTTSFRKNVIQAKNFPKRSYGWKPKIDSFSLTTKPYHPNPLIVGPPPLYWLGIGWWCSSPYVLISLSFVFVFFHSHTISAVVDWFCFVLLRVYFAHVYSLWKRILSLRLALFSFVFFLDFVFFLIHVFSTVFVIPFGLAFLSFK